jgi:hypothetical protein
MSAVTASNVMFDDATQGPGQSRMHAMSEPGQGLATAGDYANEFIEDRLSLAVSLANNGADLAALGALAEGMHVIMDMSSPSHEHYQVWNPEEHFHRFHVGVHVTREAWPTNERFEEAVRAVREYYERFRRRVCR